ncbi:MAG: universal stress protein, partial [Bacteroidota bacterium]
MKTILVPTDFSNVANQAFEYALQLADQVDSWIILFHVL